MDTLTIKRNDKHSVRLSIGNSPPGVDLTTGDVKVHVKPSLGDSASVVLFDATIDANNVVTWPLDGSLDAGRYLMEVQVSIGGSMVLTAPSDKMMNLLVVEDLA